MYRFSQFSLVIFLVASTGALQTQDAAGRIRAAARKNNTQPTQDTVLRIDDRAAFKVEQVDQDVVYVDGGKSGGLAVGMTLIIRRSRRYMTASGDEVQANIIAGILEVTSVSNTSAMCHIRVRNHAIRKGDNAWIPSQDERRKQATSAGMGAQPSRGRLSPQAAGGGFWTSPDHRPQPGAAPAPGLSIAERAQMATAYLANAPMGTTANAQTSGQAPASQKTLSVGTSARVARAERGARIQATEAASIPPQSATQTAAATSGSSSSKAVNAPNAKSASSIRSAASSPRAAKTPSQSAPSSVAANTSGVQPQIPAAAAKPTAARAVVASAAPAPVQPPASSPKPATVQAAVQATASPSARIPQTPPFTPSAANAFAKTSGFAPAATAESSPRMTAAAPPVSSVTTASIGTLPPVGSVAADANTMPQATGPTLPANVKTSFKIKYVAEDAVYIEGGKDAGLVEGMTLKVARPAAPGAATIDAGMTIADVVVVSVSNTSAVCEIRSKTAELQRGDVVMLSQAELDKLAQSTTVGPTRKYPQVIAFSEGDPLDEEQREAVPKPPMPEVNRARGRIGLDYTYINSTGAAALHTSEIGGVIRVDMTRIGGTFWNLNGYWRGSMNTLTSPSSSQPQSVYDLLNRTYTLGLTYVNPGSNWTAGVGRLFLPWATSLDTFDGGYLGRRFGKHTTIGAFAGTSPDPTSFNYNPDLRTAGSFVAFEAGSFDGLRFTSTEGIAVSGIEWAENRQFIFNETGLFYKRFLSIYNATQADKQHLPSGGIEQGLARSFSTLRLQPLKFISFDVNHNYFRDVPTFSTSLISTGLLDKFLFQGLNAGARLDLPGHVGLYGNFGQSSRSGDARNSLNQLYGLTLGRLWLTGIRADVRYSKFSSSFGSGNYRALTLSRSFKDVLRLELNAGKQTFMSSLAVPSDYKLVGSTLDWNFGSRYFIETAFNVQHGLQQNFNQWISTIGYRFDTKRGQK